MIYIDNTTDGQIIFIPNNNQDTSKLASIPTTDDPVDIDLSNYYTKQQIQANYYDKSVIDNYYNGYMDDYRYINGRIDVNVDEITSLNERINNIENNEVEVITVNDLNEVTKEKWNEIANTSNKIYVIEVVDTIMPVKKKKYRVLFSKSDISFRYIYLGAFDENAMYLVTVNNLTVGISKIELGGGSTSDGLPTYVVGLETANSMDRYKFDEIANEYVNESKEVQIFWANDDTTFTTVDVIEVTVNYRDDETYYGVISALNDKWECDIDGNVTYTNLEENNGGSSDDIEIMTILNYNLTQEQVNYICANYSTKNILFKGQYQDEDTFDWLELIRCKVYGKEDDGNWVAVIGFSDGVYRYIFDAEKVFNENDELVWQVSKKVEDIYEQTIKDVLINDLATLDGKFREIEVLLDYGNVVNILNGMQSIYVLNTRTDIIYSNIIKYIFALGSDGNNLVKYVWKKQNDNVTFSSEVIGGGGSTDGTSDVVKYDRGLENYDVFQSVAKDLVENKVVIVKKSDWDEYFGTVVSYNLNNDEGFYRGHIKYLINNNLNDIYCENENEINYGEEFNLNLNDFKGEIKDELKSYSIELGENFEMQASQFIDYKDNRDKPFILKITVWDEDNKTTNSLTLNANHLISSEKEMYNEDGDYTEKWYDGYVTALVDTQIYKWEFDINNTLKIAYNDGRIEEQYNAVTPTIIDLI